MLDDTASSLPYPVRQDYEHAAKGLAFAMDRAGAQYADPGTDPDVAYWKKKVGHYKRLAEDFDE